MQVREICVSSNKKERFINKSYKEKVDKNNNTLLYSSSLYLARWPICNVPMFVYLYKLTYWLARSTKQKRKLKLYNISTVNRWGNFLYQISNHILNNPNAYDV